MDRESVLVIVEAPPICRLITSRTSKQQIVLGDLCLNIRMGRVEELRVDGLMLRGTGLRTGEIVGEIDGVTG